MSHIDETKMRLGHIFFRDRTGIDERTVEFLKSELRRTLGQFFELKEFGVELQAREDGSAAVTVRAIGSRMRGKRYKE